MNLSVQSPARPGTVDYMRYANSVLDLIGGTPLVKLNSVTDGIKATVLAKLEFLNPGASIKDRIALKMVEKAEEAGKLGPGGTIVEPTSGNTGVGLAMVGQLKGYRTIFVTPEKVAEEKRSVLKAYGAEVVVTPTGVAPDSPESYYGVSDRLASEIEGAYKPDQFSNSAAPESHYETTGPEIWADTDGRVTHVVMGAGTGGTVTGTGRYLKDVSDGAVKVIVADPDGSVYSGGTGRPYAVEGVGDDMWPGNYDPEVPDEVQAVSDAEAFAMARRLAREEGLLVGGSSGLAVVTALNVARELPEDAVVVVVLPDSGRGYMGKFFNDDWMLTNGFQIDAAGDGAEENGETASETVGAQLTELPGVRGVDENASLSAAIEALDAAGVNVLPVVRGGHWPARVGELEGSVTRESVLSALDAGSAPDTPIDAAHAVGQQMPTIGWCQPVECLHELLRVNSGVVLLRDGEAIDVVS